MFSKKFLAIVLVVACITVLPMTALAAGRVIKLGHVVNERDGFHIAATKFKELVEEKTKGEVTIELHPNAELGDERTLLEGMQMGVIDMGVITNGPVSNFVPKIAVFELPFLFGSPEEAYYILDGPIGQKMLKELENAKLKGLAYAERGFRNLTNSKRPVKQPSDFKGLRIRVMENPVYLATFKALGANPVPMAWTEALTALQQGVIDGQENPVNVIYAFKLYETQKYLSLTRHTYAPALFVMGLNLYNSLPADVQKILLDSAQEAARYERNWNASQEVTQLEAIKKNGMQVITPNLAPFKKAVQPVYKQYEEQFGGLIEEIQTALAKRKK